MLDHCLDNRYVEQRSEEVPLRFLASGGWLHYKSKGDYFTINSHAKVCSSMFGGSLPVHTADTVQWTGNSIDIIHQPSLWLPPVLLHTNFSLTIESKLCIGFR